MELKVTETTKNPFNTDLRNNKSNFSTFCRWAFGVHKVKHVTDHLANEKRSTCRSLLVEPLVHPYFPNKNFIGKIARINSVCQLLHIEHVPSNQNLSKEMESGAKAQEENGSRSYPWLSLSLVSSVQFCLFVVKLLRKEHSKHTNPRYFSIRDGPVL